MGLKLLRTPVMLLFLMCVANCSVPALFAQNTPCEGEMFPELKLAIPQKIEHREYLHVDRNPFVLSDVNAEVLVIEFFSMYCPHCQKDAPNVNAFYKVISANPKIKSRVKVLGIGAGNSQFEVNAFRDLYMVEFPLVPDPDITISRSLGLVGTPYFFVLWKKPAGWLVVYSAEGSFGDPKVFLDLILKKTCMGRGQ